MKNHFRNILTIILVFFAMCLSLEGMVRAAPLSRGTRGSILYVVPMNKTGDCTSWEKACELQVALAKADGGDEIWVKEGTYKPTLLLFDRGASFVLVDGVAMYGGFAGTETARDQRNWVENPTILSGDVGIAGDNSDNSYHVVFAEWVNEQTILDGFTISGGNANGIGEPNMYGGGFHNQKSSHPTLHNIIFSDNYADYGGGMCNYDNSSPTLLGVTFDSNVANFRGGGMWNNQSNPSLENVTFSANSASVYGGGMYNDESSPTLTNVTFSTNSAFINGGGMYNFESSPILTNVTFSTNSADDGGGMLNETYSHPTLTNVTFSANTAHTTGGGMFNYWYSSPTLTNVTFSANSAYTGGGMYNEYYSNPTLINTIMWGNLPSLIFNLDQSDPVITYSNIEGGWAGLGGEGNINLNPLLGPLADNGGFTQTHALLCGSPSIDAGSPTTCQATDQRGYYRPIDGNGDGTPRCDMGAYEYFPFFSYLPVIFR